MIKNHNGAALVLITIALPVLLGFAALAVDVGYMYIQKSQGQTVVDAASLAGAMELPDQVAAETRAAEYAGLNGGSAAIVSFPAADQIQVDMSGSAGLFFAGILGLSSVTVNAAARAQRGQLGLLSNSDININTSLTGYGPPDFLSGDIHANGNITLNQIPDMQYGEVTAVGTVSPAGAGSSGVYTVTIDPIDMAGYRTQATRIYNELSEPDWPTGVLYARQDNDLTFNLNGDWAGNTYYAEGNINPPVVMSDGDAHGVTLVVDNSAIIDNLSSQMLAGDSFDVLIVASGNISINAAVTALSGIAFRCAGSFSFNSSNNGFVPDKVRVAVDGNIDIDLMWDGIGEWDFHAPPQPPFPYMYSWASIIN